MESSQQKLWFVPDVLQKKTNRERTVAANIRYRHDCLDLGKNIRHTNSGTKHEAFSGEKNIYLGKS